MKKEGVLSPIDFLKVSHHGSHNGTPEREIIENIFPQNESTKPRFAAVSTFPETYNGIPHAETVEELEALGCKVHTTQEAADGQAIILRFPERNESND